MTAPDFDEMMRAGIARHQSGRLSEAAAIYCQVLAVQPNHPEALHLLGIISLQNHDPATGIDLIRRAIALNPASAEYRTNLGIGLESLGTIKDAIDSYRQAIRLNPNFPLAHFRLGNALFAIGKFPEAIDSYQRAVEIQPDYALAYNNIGLALRHLKRYSESLSACEKALRLVPNMAEAHNNLGSTLFDLKRFDEAIAAFRRALDLNPEFFEARCNLGSVLREKGEIEPAVAEYRIALNIRSDLAEPHCNLAVALADLGKFEQALDEYGHALRIEPDHAAARCNRSFTLLLRGDFESGWLDHEWRWRWRDFRSPRHYFSQPMWDGTPLNGRTILLHAEQGFGDTIQFARYIPLVHARGGRIIVECQPELKRLLVGAQGIDELISRGEPIPPFHVHCPLMSLPLLFRTGLTTIPHQTPYLSPPSDVLEIWRAALGRDDNCLRVGLAWAGNPIFATDRTRSLQLAHLAPLSAVDGVTFFNFQKGPAAQQAENPPGGLILNPLPRELNDFADTAAAISLMDLMITSDTSVPHLAGALAKPVWMLLQFVPGWRWLLERSDTPWYPTMKLFRQKQRGEWSAPVSEVVDELRLLCQNKKRPA